MQKQQTLSQQISLTTVHQYEKAEGLNVLLKKLTDHLIFSVQDKL